MYVLVAVRYPCHMCRGGFNLVPSLFIYTGVHLHERRRFFLCTADFFMIFFMYVLFGIEELQDTVFNSVVLSCLKEFSDPVCNMWFCHV